MIVADRIMGVFALLTLATLAALCRLQDPLVRPAALTILVAAATIVVGVILYSAPPLRRLLRVERILAALPLGGILTRMDVAVRAVLRRPLLLGITLGLGLCSHASVLGSWLTLARAFGSGAEALDVFVYTPIILVAAALPISFGGWGVREKLAETLLGRAGVVPEVAVAISVLFAACYIVWALPGGVLLLVGRRRRR